MTKSSLLTQFRSLLSSTKWQDNEHDVQAYIYGLRGVLAISGFLWIFFETFIPTIVSNPGFSTPGPTYERILRYVFAPLFWDTSLIQSFFFTLSARAICIRFLRTPKPATFAGSIIRRIFRMVIGVGLASGIASGIFKAIGASHVTVFKEVLPNRSISMIAIPSSALEVVNSIFDMYWVVRSYYYQAANAFWPSNTIWNLSLMYQQSWTVYFLMVILPFTRASWHAQGLLVFAIGSFWMNSWGWYDAAALLLADYVINPKLQSGLQEPISITENIRLPWLVPSALMIAAGTAMRYVWAVFPQYVDEELKLHPYLDLAENTTRAQFAAADPYPRVDNFLIVFGFLILIETAQPLRSALSGKWLVALGRRSLSIFVAQSIVLWTAGIALFLHLHQDRGLSKALANFAVFAICTLTTAAFAELYWRTVDLPSQYIARYAYLWLIE